MAYAYDALNRPTRMNWPGGSASFSYDKWAVGKLVQVKDGTGQWSFVYNALGQLTSETRTMNGVVSKVRYGYSPSAGNMNALVYPSGHILRFSHDPADQIISMTLDHQPLISSITYLPFGPVRSFRAGNMVFNRDFDRRYQVTRMNGGSSDRRYTRDKNGRVTGITNVRTPSLAGLNATLGYAAESNRLEQITGAGAGRYVYDANGNTVSDGRHTFAYDALNRLVSVSVKNKVTARYTYDAWNRRTSKTAGGRTVHYHYDQDSRLIGESLANGTVLREYVYLRGEPVALLEYETQPGWYFYVTDHLGTPQKLLNAQGAVVWQAAYLPYGEAKVLKATVQNNLRFPGQYFDAETGLHYNWNRYYNPKTGRYITADPIGIAGGMNLYAYVGGDPINGYDPEGLTKRDPNSQYCKSLAQRIRNLESELEKKYREYEEDPLNLPERIGPGEGLHETRRGHRTKINETDSRLRKNLQQYMDECGGPPPASGFEPSEEMCGDDCKKVAKTAALLGAGYVVYKIGKICVLTFVGGPVGFGVGVVTP